MIRKLGLSFVVGLLVLSPLFAESRVALAGHVPEQLRRATKLERVPSDEKVPLSLLVNLDPVLMKQALDQLYGPNAPVNKHYLTSSEFAAQFGLADKRQKLKDFARANGLTVDASDDNPESMMVQVSAGAAVVEKAFGVRLNRYRGANGRIFRSQETDPMIPVSLVPHLSAVLGLSTITGVLHPHIHIVPRSAAQGHLNITGGTGFGGTLAPADIKTIYNLNAVALNGSGQTVALFELDGYAPSDIVAYETHFSLPAITVTPVSVDSTPNLCGASQNQTCNSSTFSTDESGMSEVALDIEMVAALAPGVSQILVYQGLPTSMGIFHIYNQIAIDDTAQVVSTSWGLDEQDSSAFIINSESGIFQRMALQGQTIYAASGDCGAYDQEDTQGNCITNNGFRVDDPASQPFVTGVGGTSLSGSVASPAETVWNSLPSGGATGGGVSAVWPLPVYQAGVAGTASQQFRNVPDVALNADPASGYDVCVAGTCNTGYSFGGTSAAAPLWAALTALINQQRTSVGSSVWGFANPTIYGLATSSSYNALFNDILSGNNGHYIAGTGYDNATGWGSFKGSTLIGAPVITSLSPASINAAGPAFTLTVNGANFVSGASVTWNGSMRATTYVNSGQLEAAISAADIAGAATIPVAVSNPGSGGAIISNSVNFAVGYPAYVTELLNVYAYPNPWDIRHNSDKRQMTFANLPDGATVKLFTVSGFLVKTVTASGGKAVWDLTNNSGQAVASGLYLYIASDSSAKVSGKVAIIK